MFFDVIIKRINKKNYNEVYEFGDKTNFITINSLEYYHGLEVSREYPSTENNRIETIFNKYFF